MPPGLGGKSLVTIRVLCIVVRHYRTYAHSRVRPRFMAPAQLARHHGPAKHIAEHRRTRDPDEQGQVGMTGARGARFPYALLGTWGLTRLLLLLFVFKVLVFPGPDVTSDVSVIYQGWYEILRTGTFPLDDVTWQYPPAAALPILSPAPAALPRLRVGLLRAGLPRRPRWSSGCSCTRAGAPAGRCAAPGCGWSGVPLLGPTVYARYDVMVTAVAVAALLAGARHPRVMGALVGFGAMLKVWPVLLLVGRRQAPRVGRGGGHRGGARAAVRGVDARRLRLPDLPARPRHRGGVARLPRLPCGPAVRLGRARCCSTTARWSSSARTSTW